MLTRVPTPSSWPPLVSWLSRSRRRPTSLASAWVSEWCPSLEAFPERSRASSCDRVVRYCPWFVMVFVGVWVGMKMEGGWDEKGVCFGWCRCGWVQNQAQERDGLPSVWDKLKRKMDTLLSEEEDGHYLKGCNLVQTWCCCFSLQCVYSTTPLQCFHTICVTVVLHSM